MVDKKLLGYCLQVISREVFLVSEGHRKPETYRANLCLRHKLSLRSKRYSLGFAQGGSSSLHREACYWVRSEQ